MFSYKITNTNIQHTRMHHNRYSDGKIERTLNTVTWFHSNSLAMKNNQRTYECRIQRKQSPATRHRVLV